MTDFLSHLVMRTLNPAATIQPRLPSLFEAGGDRESPESAVPGQRTDRLLRSFPRGAPAPERGVKSLPAEARESLDSRQEGTSANGTSAHGEIAGKDWPESASGLEPEGQDISPEIMTSAPAQERKESSGFETMDGVARRDQSHTSPPVKRHRQDGKVPSRSAAARIETAPEPMGTVAADASVPASEVAISLPGKRAPENMTRPSELGPGPDWSGKNSADDVGSGSVLLPRAFSSPRAQVPPGSHSPTTVRVTIGRVEVRAVMPSVPAAARRPRAEPKLSLEEYLKRREQERR